MSDDLRKQLVAKTAVKTSAELRKRLELIVPLVGTEFEDDYPLEVEVIINELAWRGAL